MTRSTQAVLIAGGLLCAALFVAVWRFGGDLAPLAGTQPTSEGASASKPYPRTARDIHGVELTLDGAPQSLASQALVTDYFLFAVVPHERIVAVSTVAHDPLYSYVADIVSRMDVVVTSNPEAVLRRKPELMLVAESARADYVEMTRASGVPVFRMRTVSETFDQIAEGLKTTGYLTGEDAAADREIDRLRERIRAARRTPRRPAYSPSRASPTPTARDRCSTTSSPLSAASTWARSKGSAPTARSAASTLPPGIRTGSFAAGSRIRSKASVNACWRTPGSP